MKKLTKKMHALAGMLFLVFSLTPAFAQRVLPSEPPPLPAYVYAIAVIAVFAMVILIVTHIKK